MISCLIHAISFSISISLSPLSLYVITIVEGCQQKHALKTKMLSNKQRVTWLESFKVCSRGNHHFKMATWGSTIDCRWVCIVFKWAPLKFELSTTIRLFHNKAFLREPLLLEATGRKRQPSNCSFLPLLHKKNGQTRGRTWKVIWLS